MKNVCAISSKSDAHRAMIGAALSKTPCQVIFETTSEDIEATRECLVALKTGQSVMECGESGSTFRFLLPIVAALGHTAVFDLKGRLPMRPLSPLYEQLENHGCKMSSQGTQMFEISGRLAGGDYYISGDISSQFITGLLFALPLVRDDSTLHITSPLQSKGYVDMTLLTLKKFGIEIETCEDGFFIRGGQEYRGPETYRVEGDWSNAAFFLACGGIGSEPVSCSGLDIDSAQGDREIVNILRKFGAKVNIENHSVTVYPGDLKGIEIDGSQIPDLVPILALIGAVADGTTRITKAERLRLKESDRLGTVRMELNKLGANVQETEDGLIIEGGQPMLGTVVNSHNDHRIAMMEAVASTVCRGTVVIENSGAVKKSYPDFFKVLEDTGFDKNLERK